MKTTAIIMSTRRAVALLAAAMPLAASCLLPSCSGETEKESIDDSPQLQITVCDETQDAATRAAYDGLTMTFSEGDAIGVYAVNGQTAVAANVRYTLRNGKWVATEKCPYGGQYRYYAYYPYTDTPENPSFTVSEDESTCFATMIGGWTVNGDQGTLERFRANDLMTGAGIHTFGRTVSFTMRHKMALAVLDSDVATFSYDTDPETRYSVAMTYGGKIPYFDGTSYYLFMRPDEQTAIGGQQLKAGSGRYVTARGGALTAAYTLSYSTDGGASFSAERPAWLKGIATSGESRDKPVNFEVTVTGEKTTDIIKSTTTTTEQPIYDSYILKNAPEVTDTDLSMCKNNGMPRTARTTANCYLVHAAGTYKIPLVYGNAIKNGEANITAYHATVTGENVRTDLVRHDDSPITAPWIKDNGITVDGAELLWQDAEGLITEVGISGDYLTFTVSGENITPGNAVVAAKQGDTIVWSWHVWVTEETLSESSLTEIDTGMHTNLNGTATPYKVAPCNVGQIPVYGTGTVTKNRYAGSTCIVRVDIADGSAMTFTVGQPDCEVTIADEVPLYQANTYYQWGRKDPLTASGGNGSDNHDTWDIDGNMLTAADNSDYRIISGAYSIGTTIQHPDRQYYNSSNDSPYNEIKYNYWDINQNGKDNITTATVKTVYDPCPPDFCVPTGNLFFYMAGGTIQYYDDNGETRWDADGRAMVWQKNGAALIFTASGYRYINSFTVSSVGSFGRYWSASPSSINDFARILQFRSDNREWNSSYRALGLTVRAVAEE